MNCLQVRPRLAAYVSGDLSAGDAAAIEAHLDGCTLCRSEAAAFERCEQALSVLGTVAAAPDLSEDLRRRIVAPVPWRPRWGVAAAVAGLAVAATAMAVLLLAPRKAPSPGPPIVREDVTRPRVVSMPQAPDVTARGPTETPPPTHSPPATVSAPRPVPAEVGPAQVASPTVVFVPLHATEPAELEEEAPIEAAPIMASLTTTAGQPGGVVLLLGRPEPVRPSPSYYLEISLPNGARSVLQRGATVGAPGAPRVVQISYEHIAPQTKAQDEGG
jgi:hypothetical protein